jgi:TP901 family phage tail tape measure protein
VALADTARLATVLTLKDGLSPGLQKAGRNVGAFDKGMGRAGKSVGRMAGGVAKAGAVVTTFAVAGLGFAAKAAIEWEDAFQGVVKTVDASDDEFRELATSIRKMSTEMPIAATELAAIAEAGGAMGIAKGDIEDFTRTVALLGTTTNVAAEDAAVALGQLGNSINLRAKDYDNFAAALVELGNKGNSTEAQILDITKRAGAFAKIARLNRRETLGWAAAVANIFGDNVEAGGTALAKFFRGMSRAFNSGNKTLQKLFGMSAKQLRQTFAEDSSDAIQTFIEKLSELKGAARDNVVTALFKDGSNLGRLVNSLADGVDTNLVPALNNANEAWTEGTAAQEEFAKRNATVRSAITRLKNGITDAAISVGEGFAPALGRAADKLAAFLAQDKNRKKLQNFGKEIGDFIDGIDFDRAIRSAETFVKAVKPAIGVIGQIAAAIAKLPPEIIGVGGATILADRLSGGMISGAAGGAVGGLAEALAKSMAAHIPVFGKAFVQPVFVTNMGGLPGGGGSKPTPLPGGAALPAVGAVATLDMEMFHRDFAQPMLTKIGHEGDQTQAAIDAARHDANSESSLIRSAYDRANVTLKGAVVGVQTAVNARSVAEVARLETIKARQQEATNAYRAGERSTGAKLDATKGAVNATRSTITARSQIETARLNAIREKQQASINAYRVGERATGAKLNTANSRLAAIKDKRMSFSTSVNVAVRSSVSVRNVNNSNTTQNNYGSKTTNKVL